MSELKPCPFCGGTAEMVQRGDRGRLCIIKCEMCGCVLETGEEDDLCGDLWNDSMASRHISQLEAQFQEADVTATAMGLALTEARMENERLRDILSMSESAISNLHSAINFRVEGYEKSALRCEREYEAWATLRDESLDNHFRNATKMVPPTNQD